MSKLFSPINFKEITLKNRIVMSPMCMYSSFEKDGMITPFHLSHYISRAIGQVGHIMVESTAGQPEGRMSAEDVGNRDDEHGRRYKQLTQEIQHSGEQ